MKRSAKKLSPPRSSMKAFVKGVSTLRLDGSRKGDRLYYERETYHGDVAHYFDEVGKKLSNAIEKSATK